MPRHRAAARESHWPLRRGGGRCAAAGSPLLSDAVAHVSSVHTSMPSMAQPDLQQKPRPNSARVQRRRPRRSQYALACTSVAAWPSSPSQVSRFCWLRHTETQVLPPQQRTPATDCARRTHLAPTRLASSGSVGQPRASQCCGIARSFNSEFSQQQQLQQSLPCHQRTTGHNQITALSKKSNDGSSNRSFPTNEPDASSSSADQSSCSARPLGKDTDRAPENAAAAPPCAVVARS